MVTKYLRMKEYARVACRVRKLGAVGLQGPKYWSDVIPNDTFMEVDPNTIHQAHWIRVAFQGQNYRLWHEDEGVVWEVAR